MFHVPFDAREKVGNERYSISGFPCLYLANTVECCKKEIGYKSGEIVAARYSLMSDIDCYDMTLAPGKIEDIGLYLKKCLLVYAASFKVKSSDRNDTESGKPKFFTYYVLPQLLTASIAAKKTGPRCIRYRSTLDFKGTNYVIIPRGPDMRKNVRYDEELKSKFEITAVSGQGGMREAEV